MNFNEYVNDIDIRVDNVRPDENRVTTVAHSVQLSWVESGGLNRA